MTTFARPLSGCAVNVSVSESEDSTTRGFPKWQVNRATLQVVTALFGQGATLVFGHDWRDDGVMEAICNFARQVQASVPLAPADADASGEPVLLNVLPWPDAPVLSAPDLDQLRTTLRVVQAGLPELLRHLEDAGRAEQQGGGPLYRYLRARGLTFLRHRLTALSHARLCLGGRRGGSQGRYPGVVEEAFLALQAHQPLYIAGLLGGASRQIIDAIDGGRMPEDFCDPARTPARDVYLDPPVQESIGAKDDGVMDREMVWQAFVDAGRNGIAKASRLTAEETDELFHTQVLDRVIELTLVGLGRLKPEWSAHPIRGPILPGSTSG